MRSVGSCAPTPMNVLCEFCVTADRSLLAEVNLEYLLVGSPVRMEHLGACFVSVEVGEETNLAVEQRDVRG